MRRNKNFKTQFKIYKNYLINQMKNCLKQPINYKI